MMLEWLNGEFSVVKWTRERKIEDLGQYSFWAKTDKELSLVCPTQQVPKDAEVCENGWNAFRVSGEMEFSLVGILAEISSCLAQQKISIFAISTYDTDYILIKKKNARLGQEALESVGWKFVE